MEKQLNFLYDKDTDVLYVSLGKPKYIDYVEVGENLLLRLEPQTRDVVGFTIIGFLAQSGQQEFPL